ncbi:MAG: hypothetical protein GTO24_23100 [candidate division Zixibacteria bacterium]|nr:hypothetical protein [candidate division Zixibacteria bacterium]
MGLLRTRIKAIEHAIKPRGPVTIVANSEEEAEKEVEEFVKAGGNPNSISFVLVAERIQKKSHSGLGER